MWVIVVCVVLVLAGLVAVVRWGGLAVEPPPTPEPAASGAVDAPPVGLVVRRYLWYVAVAMASGATAGILAAGAGGRLVMRLLAVTAGADAQGRITEAEEIVGRVTVDGTIGFVVFTGLVLGLPAAAGYLLVRRWLPAGRAAGLVYGAPWCPHRTAGPSHRTNPKPPTCARWLPWAVQPRRPMAMCRLERDCEPFGPDGLGTNVDQAECPMVDREPGGHTLASAVGVVAS